VSGRNLLRVGTRRSALAKTQTHWFINQLLKQQPDLQVEIVEVLTTGDKILDTALSKVPGKGVFVKEIEDKLLCGEIDVAVHSMKDLPTEFPQGLEVAVIPERVDPRDVFVTRHGRNFEEMPEGSRIGTSSLRRRAQLLHIRPDLDVVDIRGNIDTRLRKAETEQYDGIILAAAGLIRMGWAHRVQAYLSCGTMIPAVGQGALGIEVRSSDKQTKARIAVLHDATTAIAVHAERRFLAGMGGGCQTPMGAYCRVRQERVVFNAFNADEDGSNLHRAEVTGRLKEATVLADQLVSKLSQQT
jgi:hydroxymethylbilane synthase